MPLAVFQRMTERALATLGEPAVLRGEIVDPPRRVNVEHGVELTGLYGEVTAIRTVATIMNADLPKKGDTLDLTDDQGNITESYKLDVLYTTNGYSSRFVLVAV
jgi:hypothetical protein